MQRNDSAPSSNTINHAQHGKPQKTTRAQAQYINNAEQCKHDHAPAEHIREAKRRKQKFTINNQIEPERLHNSRVQKRPA